MIALKPLPVRDSPEYRQLLLRGQATQDSVRDAVSETVRLVRAGGDAAVRQLTERFDRVRLQGSRVPIADCKTALDGLDGRLRGALEQAAERIDLVHRAQEFREEPVEAMPAIQVWREWRPFRRVGLYAPGGRTVYPSTVLMMAIPARIAGCSEIVLCSPPQHDGRIAPAILAAAALAGATEVHAVGGAQAIAAMAYGTESLARVDKIFGPGNAYVTEAKRQVFGEVAIDMPAGPSELLVISDGSARPEWLAADLRAQTEHSPDAIAILLTTSKDETQLLRSIPAGQVTALRCASIDDAVAFANDFAPEHLSLACADPERWLPQIRSAGSIFIGAQTPAAAGDYATGANHVLPTGGAARSFGPLGLAAFGRALQVQRVDREGIAAVAAVVDVLANAEALPWHATSVQLRTTG